MSLKQHSAHLPINFPIYLSGIIHASRGAELVRMVSTLYNVLMLPTVKVGPS